MTEQLAADGESNQSKAEAREARRLLRTGLAIAFLSGVFGLVARQQMLAWGLVRPAPVNVFFRLYARHESPLILLLLVTTAATALLARRDARLADGSTMLERLTPPSSRSVGIVALLVAGLALTAWYQVHHAVLLTMDEFTSDFQARIIGHGQLRAALPSAWQPFAGALSSVFTAYDSRDGSWFSQYLPGYALLKAPFLLLGLDPILNPLLVGLSVVLLGAVARRLWPGEGLRPWLAIALFATSSEILMTSGTGYSMPAHLALNLLWLWLYQRDDARSWGFALAVGVLALGLHNPIPHALFVAPFLLRLLRERRWRRVSAAAAAYAVGGVIWMAWLRMGNPYARPDGAGLFAMFALPTLLVVWLQLVNISLLFTWHVPIFGPLAMIGIARARRLDPVLSDLASGVVLTLGFYFFFPLTQGHGWGYRYAYQILGSLALLAAAGAPWLVAATGPRRAQLVLGLSLAVGLMLQAPIRFAQGERFIRPYAAAYRYIVSRPADVVLVHGDSIWYGRDLVRNDPYLRGQPIAVNATMLTRTGRAAIESAHPGRVVDVKDGELLRLGLTLWVQHAR